jgi:uncharacterized membrane-anchored protein
VERAGGHRYAELTMSAAIVVAIVAVVILVWRALRELRRKP